MSAFQPSHLGCQPPTLQPLKSTRCTCDTATLSRSKIVELKEVQSDSDKPLDHGLFSPSIPSLENNPTSAILTSETEPNNRSVQRQTISKDHEIQAEKSNVDELKKSGDKKRLELDPSPRKVEGKNKASAAKEIANSKVNSTLSVGQSKPASNKTTNVRRQLPAKMPQSSKPTIITTQTNSVRPSAINSKTSPTHQVNIIAAVSTAPPTPLRAPMCHAPCCPNQATLVQIHQPMSQYSPRPYQVVPVAQFRPVNQLQPVARCYNGPKYQQSFTSFQPLPHYQQFQPGHRFQQILPHPPQFPLMVSFPPLPHAMAGFLAPVQPTPTWRATYSLACGFVAPFLCPVSGMVFWALKYKSPHQEFETLSRPVRFQYRANVQTRLLSNWFLECTILRHIWWLNKWLRWILVERWVVRWITRKPGWNRTQLFAMPIVIYITL